MSRYILAYKHNKRHYGQPVIIDTETDTAYWIADIRPDGTMIMEPCDQQTEPKEPPGPKPPA